MKALLLSLALATVGLGQTPAIFDAARRGDIDKLRPLLSDKAQLTARGPMNRTALHEAAASCQLEAARLLAQAGADLNALDDEMQTPEMLGRRCYDPAIATLMVKYLRPVPGTPPRPEGDLWRLQYAISRGQPDVVKMLLALGADVNSADPNGDRPLDVACLKGDAEIVRLLLERGANPKLPNKTGATPLHDAALKGNKEIVAVLLAKGADPNAGDMESGATPLHYAASFGRLEAAKVLVERGADVNRADAKGVTPLAAAEKNSQKEIAKFLRQKGAK